MQTLDTQVIIFNYLINNVFIVISLYLHYPTLYNQSTLKKSSFHLLETVDNNAVDLTLFSSYTYIPLYLFLFPSYSRLRHIHFNDNMISI